MAPVTVAPVARRGGTNGARWGIALLVTAAVLGIASVGLVMLSSSGTTSTLVQYVPADAYGYLEIRLDAPGDQRQNVANVLAKFPGFADQATLGTKLDEALDQLLARSAPTAGTFSRDIRPWLGDSIALAATGLPDPGALSGSGGGGLLLVATKDPEAARSYIRTSVAPDAATTTYGGVELSVIEDGGRRMLLGVVGNVLIGGDEGSVRAAIDTRGASTFGEQPAFRAAAAATPGDRLAFAFLDLHRLVGGLGQMVQPLQPSGPLSPESLPSWVALVVRAEPDALTATVAFESASLGPTNANHVSRLAPHLPPTTLAAVELHNLGDAILAGFNAVRESAEGQAAAEQIDQALQALGGAEELVGWIGDGSVALLANGSGPPHAGLLIRATDAEQATERLVQLRNLISLIGGSSGVTFSEATRGDVTITLYDVGPAELVGESPPPIAIGDRLVVAVAQREDLVIVGIGPAFVDEVLDTASGESLASTERYGTALDRAGKSNAGQLYVDIVRLLEVVVATMPEDDLAFYRREIAPYLEPLQAGAGSVSAGDRFWVRLVVTVKDPGR
ncbi:MAG: DUF3352 domain-containing protein [Chloroflexi bacterium]|nr:DUF3352 domain-containing protein [Chloroflexota bacterium]